MSTGDYTETHTDTTTTYVLPDAYLCLFLWEVNYAVNDFEWKLRKELKTPDPTYITDWHSFYKTVRNGKEDELFKGWQDTTHLLPSQPTSWPEYVETVLNLVPPVRAVITLQASQKWTATRFERAYSTVTLEILKSTDDVLQDLLNLHHWNTPKRNQNFVSEPTNLDPCPSSDDEDIPAILETSTPVICRFAKSLPLKETDPPTGTKSDETGKTPKEPSPDDEEAYHTPKGPTDDGPQEPNRPSEEAYPSGDDDERKALLAEGLLDDEIDQLFEEDEMNALLEEPTQPHSNDFNDEPDKTYHGAYYDSAYHDGFKNGIAELAYDNGYSAGYDDGSYEPNYHNDSASDYYSDYSYDDGYYSEAPD